MCQMSPLGAKLYSSLREILVMSLLLLLRAAVSLVFSVLLQLPRNGWRILRVRGLMPN
jgi:hypothetical protein